MSTIDLRGRALDARSLRQTLPRAEFDVEAALDAVRPICEDVRAARRAGAARPQRAVRRRPPGPTCGCPPRCCAGALDGLDPDGPRRAGGVDPPGPAGARATSAAPTPPPRSSPGGTVTERWVPVDRVGLYVPGGARRLPEQRRHERRARPGGRRRRRSPWPARRSGTTRPASPAAPPDHPRRVRAARGRRGLRRRRRPGGRDVRLRRPRRRSPDEVVCEPVDLVTGPGNIYVVAAKRLLKGLIGIDAEAGPTEIAILADDTRRPAHVAADLVSQAEHDPLAAAVLVTDSEPLADAVEAALDRPGRRDQARRAGAHRR